MLVFDFSVTSERNEVVLVESTWVFQEYIHPALVLIIYLISFHLHFKVKSHVINLIYGKHHSLIMDRLTAPRNTS